MNKITSALLLSISVFIVFIQPTYFKPDIQIFWALSIVMIAVAVYSSLSVKNLFPTILFFTLIHVSTPLNEWFTGKIGLYFPGTYYLIPIMAFTGLILVSKPVRQNISWWRKDQIDKTSVILIASLAIISGLALYIWGHFIAKDLNVFVGQIPNVTFAWIVLNGLGFSIFNAIAEEYLSRGMLCNGLEKILENKFWIIALQAIIFGIFHFQGFPGGLIGVCMVIAWSVVLGIIRYRTKGLTGVLTGHFFADLTIYFILYSLK